MNDREPDAWGPLPTDEEFAAALAVGREAVHEARRIALADALGVDEAADRLGTTAAAVAQRITAKELLALDDGGELRLPAWQFTAKGEVPGLRDVIAAWPGTALSLSMFAVRPSPDFAGRTPGQELARRGGPRRVVERLRGLSAARW